MKVTDNFTCCRDFLESATLHHMDEREGERARSEKSFVRFRFQITLADKSNVSQELGGECLWDFR